MIPFASQRGGGQDLATHLQNTHDNDFMEVAEIRGAIAEDLHGAFKEWQVQAETLTRCRKFLYSMSINPDPRQGDLSREQYYDYIARTEQALDLIDQPRAIVFHTKNGREHCHVVWSRVDPDQQKAVHIAFDRDKLMRVTRDFAREHFLDLPAGYDKSRSVRPDTLYERALQNQTGLSKADHKRQVTQAWQLSDDAKSFVQALAERGYLLARGTRPYVLVDLYGGMHALSKLIDDKDVKTRDVRAFLEFDYPEDSLPSVEEAEALVARHRKLVEKSDLADQLSSRVTELKHAQQLRRLGLEQELSALKRQHKAERAGEERSARDEKRALRNAYSLKIKEIRSRRHQSRPTGLAAFLGRVSGVDAIRRAVHRYKDAKLLATHQEERGLLTEQQISRRETLGSRQILQSQEMERKSEALLKIERRELTALKRDIRREQRTHARGHTSEMPSLAKMDRATGEPGKQQPSAEFTNAAGPAQSEPLDVVTAFNRAASDRQSGRGDSEEHRVDYKLPGKPPGKKRYA